jgi:L-ascorbate metabolism protein UlaG (beta-lactamase superfamily)
VQSLSAADVLLIPVGGRQTIGPSQAAEVIGLLEPRVVIPMHYKTKTIKTRLQPVGNFLAEMGLPNTDAQDHLSVSRSSLPPETQVVILNYRE